MLPRLGPKPKNFGPRCGHSRLGPTILASSWRMAMSSVWRPASRALTRTGRKGRWESAFSEGRVCVAPSTYIGTRPGTSKFRCEGGFVAEPDKHNKTGGPGGGGTPWGPAKTQGGPDNGKDYLLTGGAQGAP